MAPATYCTQKGPSEIHDSVFTVSACNLAVNQMKIINKKSPSPVNQNKSKKISFAAAAGSKHCPADSLTHGTGLSFK